MTERFLRVAPGCSEVASEDILISPDAGEQNQKPAVQRAAPPGEASPLFADLPGEFEKRVAANLLVKHYHL
jgi:hypothetical protein